LNVKLDLSQAEISRFNPEAVEDLFHQLEFRTLTQRLHTVTQKLQPSLSGATQASLFGEAQAAQAQAAGEYETIIVDSEVKLQDCLKDLSNCKQVAFDTETTSIIPTQADLVGISLAGAPKRGYYLPVGHKSGHQLPLETLQKALKPLLKTS